MQLATTPLSAQQKHRVARFPKATRRRRGCTVLRPGGVLASNRSRCSRSCGCRFIHSPIRSLPATQSPFTTVVRRRFERVLHLFRRPCSLPSFMPRFVPCLASSINRSAASVIPVRTPRVSLMDRIASRDFSRNSPLFALQSAAEHPACRHCGSTRTPAPQHRPHRTETGYRAAKPGTPGRRNPNPPNPNFNPSRHERNTDTQPPASDRCSGCLATNSNRFNSAN